MCVLLLGTAAAGPLAKDPILKWHDDPKVDCANGGTTDHDVAVCQDREYWKAYRALTTVYDKLYGAYDAANRQALEASERAFEQYMAAECGFETFPSRTTNANAMNLGACRLGMVRERTRRLQAQIDCPEGVMTCNHP
jgi:uncharacterized protein YecT (DUF1311 family)